jgi:tetratricopeptide (TPR) repeat protein
VTEQLAPRYVEGDPRGLTLLDLNARYMTHEQYARLVANLQADGALTSTPLVWNDQATGRRIVLSGNHRTKAAIDAGLQTIGWLEIDQPLPRQRQVALQLSHNAITGQDDPAMLRELFEELEDIAEREYSGLDDKTLELLESVSVESLNEADLDYASVQILFLPGEKDAALEAFEHAAELGKADARWLAGIDQYEPALDALESAKAAHNVGNIATALGLVLGVFEAHLGDLRDGWYDPDIGEARHKGRVPIESLLATRTMPAAAAAVVAQAITKAEKAGDLDGSELWRVLEMWATGYLAP